MGVGEALLPKIGWFGRKIALNGDVTGGPAKVSGTEQMDFSESFITLGNKTFWTLKSDIRRANQRLYCLV